MAYNDYQSVLYPVGSLLDQDWQKDELIHLSTAELKERYKKYSEELQKLREQEPAKKRARKKEYRSWVSSSHDLRDLLNEIAAELNARGEC